MQHLHLVTGLFSLINSVAAAPPASGDSHAVILLYQSQPAAIAAFRAAAQKLLPGAPVVVLDSPANYRSVLAQRGYFADDFDDPDVITAFHTHSIPEHDAILKGFPDARLRLVDEGAASYYPNLIDRHLDIDRIERVDLHNYLGLFTAHETTGFESLVHSIDRTRFIEALTLASTLPEGSGSPKSIGGRPVVVLSEQYFFQKRGVDISIEEQALIYAAAINDVIGKGYGLEYRRHPRESNALFTHTLKQLDREVRRWVRLDTRPVALAEFDLIAGNRPAAVLGVSSTSMLTAPDFFGVPSFRIDTDIPLRLAKAAFAESAGIVNNHTRFRAMIPDLDALPIASAVSDVVPLFEGHVARARQSKSRIDAALFTGASLPAAIIDKVRTVLSPSITTVSFDAFDTLVVRPGVINTDVLALADRHAFEQGLLPLGLRFSAVRRGAPRRIRASRDDTLSAKPELTLDDIYSYIQRSVGVSDDVRDRLRQLEIDVESTQIRPRRFGAALLALAKLVGKRVLVISDTFFNDQEFSLVVLSQLAVGPDRVYLSSVEQATKSSGELFDVVLAAEDIHPAELLHIGDSKHSDVDVPAALGIDTLHTPDVFWGLFGRSALGKRLTGNRDKRAFSFSYSLIAKKFFDVPGTPVLPKALSRSDPYFLGYSILGPAFFHWVLWVVREAQRRGNDELLFLSRDGALPLRIYEIVCTVWPDAPRAQYVYGSRAIAINVFNAWPGLIAHSEEVHGFGALNTAEQVIRTRFGEGALDALRPIFEEYGLGEGSDMLEDRLWAFRALLAENSGEIAALTAERASRSTEYYRRVVAENSNAAVVDFGYSGSTQRAISAAVGQKIGGFYFTRKENNIDYSDMLSMDTAAFSDNTTFFVNGGFIEFLSTPDTLRSVLDFTNVAETIEPVFDEAPADTPEIRKLQQGVIDFASDYVAQYGDEVAHITCRVELATQALATFLNSPLPGDLALFENMGHQDALGNDRGFALDYWRAGRDYRAKKGGLVKGEEPGRTLVKRARRRLGRAKRAILRKLVALLE